MNTAERFPTYNIPAATAPSLTITRRVKIIWLSRDRDADAEALLSRLINDGWMIVSSGSAGEFGFVILQSL